MGWPLPREGPAGCSPCPITVRACLLMKKGGGDCPEATECISTDLNGGGAVTQLQHDCPQTPPPPPRGPTTSVHFVLSSISAGHCPLEMGPQGQGRAECASGGQRAYTPNSIFRLRPVLEDAAHGPSNVQSRPNRFGSAFAI